MASVSRDREGHVEDEEQHSGHLGRRLSLRTAQVDLTLHHYGVAGASARVVLVLDASASMAGLYRRGAVADLVERVAAVAARLDAEGGMRAWTFASNPARLPDVDLAALPEWLRLHVRVGQFRLFGRPRRPRRGLLPGQTDMRAVGIQNEEHKAIAAIRAYVRDNPAPAPTLVLFFSDGGIHRDREIEAELRASVEEPVFWQFVGLGHSDYGVLTRLNTLPGRPLDNAAFFPLDDITRTSDAELYDRLLCAFPTWLTAANRAGILD
ncbi:hypothetical protein GT042_20485 [Streptomyces sp. SID3212]|nr:hypothetical protein [Streptomyces sp. SID3212]